VYYTQNNADRERKRDLVFRTDSHGPSVYTLCIYTCPVSTRLYVRCSNTRRRRKSRKKRVFIIYTRVHIHYDDVRLFSLHSWWVYYITGPSITSAINAVFIINMLIVFCGTPKNSENGVEPKFLLWIQGTNKRIGPQDDLRECDRKNVFPVVDILSDVNPLFLGGSQRGSWTPYRTFFHTT